MDQEKFFKGSLPQILLGPIVDTQSHITYYFWDLCVMIALPKLRALAGVSNYASKDERKLLINSYSMP